MYKLCLLFLMLLALCVEVQAQVSPAPKNYLTTPEGKKYFKGRTIRDPAAHKAAVAQNLATHANRRKALPHATAASFDCRTLGWVVPVDSQMSCGSCWAFSGTEVVDCCYLKTWGSLSPGPFSKQYTLDCGQNGGCNGDDNTNVLAWAKEKGLPNKDAYGPYTASPGQCKGGLPLFKIQDWMYLDGQGVGDTQKIKDGMVAYGPVGCAVAAGGSQFWNDGMGTDTGRSNNIDHDVLLVGWDDIHDNGDGSKGAWIMQNSWGTDWGSMKGCAWMKYGSDSIGTEPVVAIAPPPPGPPPPPPPAPGAPVISSPLTVTATMGQPFSYQITATNAPTSYAATGLPIGLTCCGTGGTITGTPGPVTPGPVTVTLSATNAVGTGTASLVITLSAGPTPPPGPGPSQLLGQGTLADGTQFDMLPAGALTVSGDMPLRQFMEVLVRCREKKTPYVLPRALATPPAQEPARSDRLDALEKEVQELKRGTDAIIKLLLKQQKTSRRNERETIPTGRADARLHCRERPGRRELYRPCEATGTVGCTI
jgi:C1A family cysteine protease